MGSRNIFDHGVLLVAFVKSGVELAFETMVSAGIIEDSAYYESLHELPLIANTIARKKLFEMNRVISDTAEYGCYLFDHACKPLLTDFMKTVDTSIIGTSFSSANGVDNIELIAGKRCYKKSSNRSSWPTIESCNDSDENHKI